MVNILINHFKRDNTFVQSKQNIYFFLNKAQNQAFNKNNPSK